MRVFEELPAWERGTSESCPWRGQEYVFSDMAPSPAYNQGNSLCSPRKTKASGYVSDQDQRWYAGESDARLGTLGTVWPLSGSTESALAAWLLLCSHTSPVPTQPRSEIKRVSTHLILWGRTRGWTQIVSSQVRRAGQTQLQSPFSSLEGKGYLSICLAMHVSMQIYSGTHTHTHTHVYTHIHVHTMHTCTHIHMHAHVYIHINAHHTDTHTCTYMHITHAIKN